MTATRAQLRTRILQRADATGSGRWDTTAGVSGEVDQLMTLAYDREWIGVLDADPSIRATSATATADSTGLYAISDLTTAISPSRLHRILAVYRDGLIYRHDHLRSYAAGAALNPYHRVWYRIGTGIQMLPVGGGNTATFTLITLPQALTGLSSDSTAITTPSDDQDDTFTEIVALETAASLLLKGAAETTAAQVLQGRAESLRSRMLQDIARLAEGPMQMRYDDHPSDWAGFQ